MGESRVAILKASGNPGGVVDYVSTFGSALLLSVTDRCFVDYRH
jgi:hypothetical protein